ncbi:cisplatin damage response ATP-dependent DNA ligase [Falsigemmobacter intermedius]|uniref:DNA ligase (ATP) n=1 Tax=Falsigemmobacter intermedius TaxID=1553448 RepID=A0A3S3YJJ5_9RHOB|nr:cisplatin damage response ATP-dependent DNA ligase [Falsigemmobacter intermedius]RWY44671.1 cisplatin damage response ATP-dependent DNA ligase [Falsigemmobacter intermedius]
MRSFAALLERLAFTPGRNASLTLMRNYLTATPDPDRGWALAVLTGGLELRHLRPQLLRRLAAERVDEQLFAISYEFVGDLAETIALLWPEPAEYHDVHLSQAVALLAADDRAGSNLVALLNQLPKEERFALLKLATGNLRVGVSGRLARTALAGIGTRSLSEIEEIWHGLAPPYPGLFDWLAGGPLPEVSATARFRPVMLSTPVTEETLPGFDPADYAAEWKWDGIRVQLVCEEGQRRIYARSGDEISGSFPDLLEGLDFEGAVDGELLVARGGVIAPFADLQKRLGRKTVSRATMAEFPAHLRLYDLLQLGREDLRPLPFRERRQRLEALPPLSPRVDLSPLLPFEDWQALAALRADPPEVVIERVMLKAWDSPYLGGRPRGPWLKWKRAPMQIDAVLLYAQAGHGKRAGYYSDLTFGLWHQGALVPVGKAYSGFTDEELKRLDRFIRKETRDRFGPVRQVTPSLVLEVAFEGVNRSARHKSGVALRFPRVSRIRWDKPAAEADQLSALEALL